MDDYTGYAIQSVIEYAEEIISELTTISLCLKEEFKGIGSDYCANRIDIVIKQYEQVNGFLNQITPPYL